VRKESKETIERKVEACITMERSEWNTGNLRLHHRNLQPPIDDLQV